MQVERKGSGEPLVMLGGILTGATGMAQVAQHLASSRQVLLLQNLNVTAGGAGRPLPAPYGVQIESCALLAALDQAGIAQPVDLVGYSYGGLISLELALRHPERVRTLTLIEPPAWWLLSERDLATPNQAAFRNAARSFRGESPDDAGLARFVCLVFGCPPGDPVVTATQLPSWPMAVRHRASLRAAHAVVDHRRERKDLKRLRLPLLYVSGSATSPFHASVNHAFRRSVPAHRHVELPGGHAVPSVAAPALAKAISDFTDASNPRTK